MKLSVPVTVTDPASGGSATATATCSVRIPFGVNTAAYGIVSPSLSGVSFTKSFADTGLTNGVPAKWPGNPKYSLPAGTTTLACFRPDPQMTISGQLDSLLTAFIKQAPAGSWLTAWQEANDPGNSYWSQPGASVSQLVTMHAYLHALVKKTSPAVLYGEDLGTYPVYAQGQDITSYTCPGLDWYSLDGYDPKGTFTPEAVFGKAWQGILAAAPGARPAITETNSADTTGAWFTACWEWLSANRGVLFSTFWNGPAQKYLYDPSAGYVAALQAISDECAA